MSCKKEAEGGAALPCCQWEKLKASPGGGRRRARAPPRAQGFGACPRPGKRCASGAARRPGAAGGQSGLRRLCGGQGGRGGQGGPAGLALAVLVCAGGIAKSGPIPPPQGRAALK